MAYVVDATDAEPAQLGSLRPSSGASLETAVRSTFRENPATLIYDLGVLRQANAIPKQRLSRGEAEQRVKDAGVKLQVPEDGYTQEALDILIQRRREDAAIRSVQERTPWSWMGSPVRGAASLLTGVLDPLNVASAFVPVVGQMRAARMLEQAGASAFARAGARARIGATEGAAGAALMEPLVYGAHSQLGDDYGMADSLVNLGFGTILGGGLHITVGAVGDFRRPKITGGSVADVELPAVQRTQPAPGSAAEAIGLASPEMREVALRTAVADMVQGRAPDVEPVLRIDSAERAANFKAWFGESKVVDDAGAPMVVYHVTGRDFDTFRTEGNATTTGDRLDAAFFTRGADYAQEYAAVKREAGGAPSTVPAFLALRNPLEVDAPTSSFSDPRAEASIIKQAREAGHDGVIFRSPDGDAFYAAFDPKQVKSAIGNSGKFDPNSPSLTDSIGAARSAAARQPQPSPVSDPSASRAADERLQNAPKSDELETAKAQMTEATQRLDELRRNLETGGMDPARAARLVEGLKVFDEGIADAKNIGAALREYAICGVRS